MSKTLKKSILLLIITLGFLILPQTCVNGVNILSAEEAFEGKSAIINEKTITLTGNVEFKNPNWIEDSAELEYDCVSFTGDDYILDLNGYKLVTHEIYIEDGELTINDSKGNGEIDTKNDFLQVYPGSKLIINNGKLDYLANEGESIINNGTIGYITNYGTITIEKGSFNGIWQMGSATIKGGTFTARIVNDNKQISSFNLDNTTTTITGGEFIAEGELENAIVLTSKSYIDYDGINKIIGNDCKVKFDYGNSESYPPTAEGEEYYCEAFYGKTVKITKITDAEKNLIKKIAPDGKNATLKTVKPKDMMESDFLLTNIANKLLNEENYYAYAWCPTEDLNTATITIEGEGFSETYDINVTYDEPKENSYVKGFIEQLKEFNQTPETAYQVSDLGLINYYMTGNKSELWNNGAPARALRFSDEIIELSDGGNIKFYLDVRAGEQGDDLMFENAFGEMTVFYNDYAYANKQQGIHLRRVIYIPQSTANSTEAYVQAAQERINKYLGAENLISVAYGGKLESLEEEMLDSSVPTNSTDGNYYNITVKGRTYKFYILKGTEEQLKEPIYQGKDIDSNVKIKSSDASVPLDTSVKATKVKNDILKEVLETENYEAYDISLYSDAKGASIKELENDKFLVSIPVPEILKDKNITVYYIDSDGNKTVYDATVKDEFASFSTDHFSTYALVEKINSNDGNVSEDKEPEINDNNNTDIVNPDTENTDTENNDAVNTDTNNNNTENNDIGNTNTNSNVNTNIDKNNNTNNSDNPQTGDNIVLFVVVLFVAFVGIIVTIKIKKHIKQ